MWLCRCILILLGRILGRSNKKIKIWMKFIKKNLLFDKRRCIFFHNDVYLVLNRLFLIWPWTISLKLNINFSGGQLFIFAVLFKCPVWALISNSRLTFGSGSWISTDGLFVVSGAFIVICTRVVDIRLNYWRQDVSMKNLATIFLHYNCSIILFYMVLSNFLF